MVILRIVNALLTVPAELSELYAFHYISPDIPDRQHGWNLYDIRSEYLRMGVCSENWTLTNINREYEVSRGGGAKWLGVVLMWC